MNFIVHYRIIFGARTFDAVTTVRTATSATDAGTTVLNMVRATAPTSVVEIIGVKEPSEEDFNRFIALIRL